MSPSWFEVGSKVKVEPLGVLRFFDVRMGGEVSSEEEDRTLFFSNINFLYSFSHERLRNVAVLADGHKRRLYSITAQAFQSANFFCCFVFSTH